MQGKCIIFSAPSGAGKTTIVQQLLLREELKLEFSISATTRSPRGQEVQGKDYYFLSVPEFKNKIEKDALIEWEEVYENSFYGTLKSELNRIWEKGYNVAFDVDVKGGINMQKLFGDRALSIFICPPSLQVLEQRLRGRGTETEEKIQQRLARAEYELSFANYFDVQIVNDNLEKSIEKAVRHIKSFIAE
jgi:guanylate kinase